MTATSTAGVDRPRLDQSPGFPRAERLASLASMLVMAAGITGVVSALVPAQRGRLRLVVELFGLPATAGAAGTSVLLGVLLVLVARGLRRRQRRAWALALPLLAAGAIAHLVKGLDVEEASLCLAGLGVLVVGRKHFCAVPDPDEQVHPLRLFLLLVGVSMGAGLLLLQIGDTVDGSPGLVARATTVLVGLVGLDGPVVLAAGQSELVTSVLLALGVATVLLPLGTALRTSRGAASDGLDQQGRVRALLVDGPAGDSLDWFALRSDKQAIFSNSGKAAVSYRVEAGVALASADPLGDPEAWPGAIEAFLSTADRYGWTPAVLGCSERGGTAWTRAGLLALEVGDEAVLDPATFSLAGRSMRDVRQAVNRTERAGWSVVVRRVGEVPADELAALRGLADSWRDGPVERGFSMALGRIGGVGDERCVLATASRDGEVQALLHFVPWGLDGLSLDLMRRARGSDNGVNELLITRAVMAAPALGVRRVSLNFAVFRRALEQGGRLGAGPVLRRWRGLLLFASRFWQIDSLYRFNDKFGPSWHPRYVCYRRPTDLPRVVLAALQAEAFLPRPRLSRLVRRPWT